MKSEREKMQSFVSQWKDSESSQAEFACRNELNLHMFRHWVSKHRKQEHESPVFITLDGYAATGISLHYPNGVELSLSAQTSLGVLKGLIQFEARCSR